MILAAGLGTRLRPLTNDRPKALVEVAGCTMLELTLLRLRASVFAKSSSMRITSQRWSPIISVSIENFGMQIEISYEDVLLDTGGGIKRAAHFFLGSDEPFLVHNVDVLSTIDFSRMLQFHMDRMRSRRSPFRTVPPRVIFSSTITINSVAVAPAPLAIPNSFAPPYTACPSVLRDSYPVAAYFLSHQSGRCHSPSSLRTCVSAAERNPYLGSVQTGTIGETWAVRSISPKLQGTLSKASTLSIHPN